MAAYLEACAARPGPSGLRRVLAALAQRHRVAGQPWPAGDPLIACALADLKARAPRPRRAATFALFELWRLVAIFEEPVNGTAGLAAYRNRTLLLASFSASPRRSELAAFRQASLAVHLIKGE